MRYEAEAATLAGGATVQTEHAGYSGDGYVGGYEAEGASTTFTATALADAETDVTLGYANGGDGARTVSLYVNDQFAKQLALPDTGGWDAYGTLSDTLRLRAGSNAISIRYDAGDDGDVNLDYLDVTQNEPIQCPPTFEPDDEFDGDALDRCRWSTVLDEDPSALSVADGKLQIEAHGGRHRRHHAQRTQRRAPAGAGRRELGGDHEAVDRRRRRLRPGRARRARERVRVGQARRDAQPGGRVGARARARIRLPEQRDRCRPARRTASRCSCSRRRAGCAAATRSTTARPGPRSARASR